VETDQKKLTYLERLGEELTRQGFVTQLGLAAGHPAQARRHWQQALALHIRLATPETEQVRATLRTLGPGELITKAAGMAPCRADSPAVTAAPSRTVASESMGSD
jgi:hypothetical protein